MENLNQFRITSQRRVILDEVRNTTLHPTAADVYELVRRRIPSISLGTVYRNLEFLCEQGVIQCLRGGDQRRYDADLTDHYHIRCTVCGRMDDLPVAHGTAAARIMADDLGYEILSCAVDFLGICPSCRARRGARAPRRAA